MFWDGIFHSQKPGKFAWALSRPHLKRLPRPLQGGGLPVQGTYGRASVGWKPEELRTGRSCASQTRLPQDIGKRRVKGDAVHQGEHEGGVDGAAAERHQSAGGAPERRCGE
eukprot:CAMPEP_0194326952 /NCGR_PEP_ID=MMETSP0171-20130528/39043_1 /TAXON_ID=218684 /ORGANISM="Corethron pennatum, Strain L29A3" /LENGTH=110 /DNA_ID=CAMNT_0039086723 /DNA_START=420 /DNA_END=753 /DNA_ORIENTATION=-